MKDSFDQPKGMKRRVFIKGLGNVSLGLVFGSMFGGCESLREKIINRPVRRRLRTGSAEVNNAIAIYKDAVNTMQALPGSNPRSWAAQAGLHGTVANGFNFCQHGTTHFFSWHRAYLFYFEQICQELTGEKDFALPYWNWNQNPAMHSEFTSNSSPLFHPRNNTSVAGNSAFSNNTMDTILGDNNFFTFSSQLEGSPHNTVHNVVGQDMGSGGSPIDPIFWPHHCMVDYCWAKWNIELENDNTNDSGWSTTEWHHFVNGNGNPVSVTAGTTTLMPLLSYRYETSQVGGFAAGTSLSVAGVKEFKTIETRIRKGADIHFEVKKRISIVRGTELTLAKPFSTETNTSSQDFSRLIDSATRAEKIFLNINYAKLPPFNDFFVRVFINLPEANRTTSTNDVHFAGSFAFFGTDTGSHSSEHASHHPKTDFLVNVTETLQRLKRGGELKSGSPVTVQLIAVPTTDKFVRADTRLMLEEIEFLISAVNIR